MGKKTDNKRKRPVSMDSDCEPDGCTGNDHFPRFLLIHRVDTESGKTMLDNPFAVSKAIEGLIGTTENIKRLRSGDILIETKRKKQTETLLSVQNLLDTEVRIVPHRNMNTCKGVIRDYARQLYPLDMASLREGLKSQGVTEVRRIPIRREGKEVSAITYVLTFGTPTLPPKVKAGYLVFDVTRYIPNPLRCYKCQAFGHHEDKCSRQKRCVNCGETEEVCVIRMGQKTDCIREAKCVNCQGDHPASSKSCPKWTQEKEIQRIRCTEQISFPEARKRYNEKHDPKNPTYANITASTQTVSTAVQTDISYDCKLVSSVPADSQQKKVDSGHRHPRSVSRSSATRDAAKSGGEANKIPGSIPVSNRFENLGNFDGDESNPRPPPSAQHRNRPNSRSISPISAPK